MVDMILLELEERKNFLSLASPVQTVYFGGGTPSLLNEKQLESIINALYKHYKIDLNEFTLEANPDDLQPHKLKNLKSLGIDRLSIGIQSFNEGVLKFYNRAHNRQESLKAIDLAKEAGFEKLSIDLIYGFPYETHSIWEKDLEQALVFDPGHISSYALTIEPKTAFGNWLKKGDFKEAPEDFVAEQFELLQKHMAMAGYIQYEISNFGKEGQFALHNTNYWIGIPYLGIGPSAHSFDGKKRGHNIANNALYMKSIREGKLPYQVDDLTEEELVNEYILTSLRTLWGCNLDKLSEEFGVQLDQVELEKLIELELISIHENAVKLTDKGKLLADAVAASLFIGL